MCIRDSSEAVAVAKGEKPEVQNTECLVDIRIGAHIPEDYIESLPQRIDIYKKIASVENEKDASDIIDELIDRFGTPPELSLIHIFHHARHGSSCTGADGNQQRIVDVAEFFAGKLFEFSKVFKDFSLDFRADLFAVFIILGACLGCNGEALWNRHTEYGHFCKVCAFASEQFTHFCVSFRKRINKFLVQ